MIQIHHKEIPYHRKDSSSAEPEAEISNTSPFDMLDNLVAIFLYLRFAFSNTDCIISLSMCGKKNCIYRNWGDTLAVGLHDFKGKMHQRTCTDLLGRSYNSSKSWNHFSVTWASCTVHLDQHHMKSIQHAWVRMSRFFRHKEGKDTKYLQGRIEHSFPSPGGLL